MTSILPKILQLNYRLFDLVITICSTSYLPKVLHSYLPTTNIRVDNGSEFISKALDTWAYDHQVSLNFSRPGKPTDNGYIESSNGSLREECLNIHWFLSLEDAREKIDQWRWEYNAFRPHSALNDLTPDEMMKKSKENCLPEHVFR